MAEVQQTAEQPIPNEKSQENSQISNQEGQDDSAVVNSRTKKALIFWGYLVVYLAFFVVCVYFTIAADNKLVAMQASDAYYYGNQVAYTWKKGFINDVKVLSSSASCPNNYEKAFSFSWPGSGYGCYCSASNNVSFVLEGYCTAQLIQRQCVNLKSQNSTTASNWRNNSLICIRRSVVSLYNQPSPNSQTKICGKSNSLVIVPVTEPCPYVNISYTPFPLQNNMVNISSTQLPKLYASFDSTSAYSFYSYPIVNFKVEEYQFCLIDTDQGIDPDHSDYLLLNNYRGCAQVGNYTTIDTIDEATFYSVNSNLNALTAIKGFPTPGNWDYNLGFLSMPSWTYKCRFNYQKNYNIPNATDIVTLGFRTLQQGLYYPVYAVFAIVAIEILVLFLRRVFSSTIYPQGFKKVALPKEFVTGLLRIILELVCKGLLFAIYIFLCYKCYQNWNWIMKALNMNCPDSNPQLINQVLTPYQQMYTSLYSQYTVLVAVCVVMLVIDIVYNVYVYHNELRFYLESASGQKLVDRDDLDKQLAGIDKDLMNDATPADAKMDDKFKKTMAADLFGAGANEAEQGQRRKKKKKRLGGKNLFNNEQEPSGAVFNDFNPYELEVQPADSIQNLAGENEVIELGIQRQSPRKKLRRR